jgi:IS5 family transposase
MMTFKNQNTTGSLFGFGSTLIDSLDQANPLIILALTINWAAIESFMARFFDSDKGRPSLPIRLMVGLQIIKYMYNLSDERVIQYWLENPYCQVLTGEDYFTTEPPCDPSELSRFRIRIGQEGAEFILAQSVIIHGEKALEKEVIADTTVQEKYTKFPTDIRLALDVIEIVLRIAKIMCIKMSRSYSKETKKLKNESNFSKGKMKKALKKRILKRLRTIASKLLRELKKKLPAETMNEPGVEEFFQNATKAITQQPNDKNKIYSIFEPQVCCIAKGKEHKKYEFGSKVSLVIGASNGLFLFAENFSENVYDGNTLNSAVEGLGRLFNGYKPELVIADRGYRGRKAVGDVVITTPYDLGDQDMSPDRKKQIKGLFCRRSSIEPLIGHVKQDHRLGKNFLRGVIGDKLNPILAAAAFNLKKFVGIFIEAVVSPFKRISKKSKAAATKLHGWPFRRIRVPASNSPGHSSS